jgi:group I intron endonuclease
MKFKSHERGAVMFVYLIRNIINGKCYVGKTTRSVEARWRQHKTEIRIGRMDSDLYADMRKFGVAAFEVGILGECNSQRRLAQMERSFIRSYNAVEEGYNKEVASFGGRIRLTRSRFNPSLSDDHRKKIANSVRRAWVERKEMAETSELPRKFPPVRIGVHGSVVYAAA